MPIKPEKVKNKEASMQLRKPFLQRLFFFPVDWKKKRRQKKEKNPPSWEPHRSACIKKGTTEELLVSQREQKKIWWETDEKRKERAVFLSFRTLTDFFSFWFSLHWRWTLSRRKKREFLSLCSPEEVGYQEEGEDKATKNEKIIIIRAEYLWNFIFIFSPLSFKITAN